MLLFVYGTLMRGYDHPMARHLAANADWRGAATCTGKLYRISSYPGLVLSSDPSDIVHGDLFALRDEGLFAELDAYEGCGADDPSPHPYRRAMIDVVTLHGPTQAWTYIYQAPVDEGRRIVSGRFA